MIIRVCSYLLHFCYVQDAISSAFDAAWQYAGTFEPYRQFYQENESLDLEAIRQEEHGIDSFKFLLFCRGVNHEFENMF